MLQITLIIFFLFAAFAVVLPANTRNTKLYWGMGFIMFLLAAFRDGATVNDYAAYVEMFNQSITNVELSFFLITKFIKTFSANSIWLFVVYALLGVYLKLRAIKAFSEFWLFSILIYFSYFFILHELTQIRVGVATGFFLFAVKAIYDRNLKFFLVFVGLASFFHYSAIIILPLWFLSQKKINLLFYALLIPSAYLFYFLNINLVELVIENIPFQYIQDKYSIYKLFQQEKIGGFEKINVFGKVFLVKYLLYYLLLWKNKFIASQNKYALLLMKVWGIGLALFVFLATMPVFAFRVSEILSVVEFITIPFFLYIFKPTFYAKISLFVIASVILLINIFYVKLIL
ncbi:MAG: EpsG family protein [Bacteroidales bacterium]